MIMLTLTSQRKPKGMDQRGVTFHKPSIPTGVEEGMHIFMTQSPRYKRVSGGSVPAR